MRYSKRKYQIVGYELNGELYAPFIMNDVSLDNILDSDSEWAYAIQDEVDKLIDLQSGEHMTVRADRSDENSSMIITRIDV